MGAAAQRNLIPGAGQVLRIMNGIWQAHTQLIAVVGLIFILVTCVSLAGFLPSFSLASDSDVSMKRLSDKSFKLGYITDTS